MILEILNVEHGACALITTNAGKHILIDCGDNTSKEPGTALRARDTAGSYLLRLRAGQGVCSEIDRSQGCIPMS
jgi:hypothetical protein